MPLAVFLVFVLLGPPIGFVVFVLEMNVAEWLGLVPSRSHGGGRFTIGLDAILGPAVISYLVGGVQALFTALVALISLGRNAGTRISLWAILLASGASSAPYVLLIGRSSSPDALGAALFVSSWHLGAGLGAWALSTILIGIAGKETAYGWHRPEERSGG
jgi:hypothetical protein